MVCKSGCCDSLSLWKSQFLKDLAISHYWHCVSGSVEVKQFLSVFWLFVHVFDVFTSNCK